MTSLMDARNRAHDAIVVDDEEALRVALEQTPEVVHHVHGNGNSLLHLAAYARRFTNFSHQPVGPDKLTQTCQTPDVA